MVISLSNSSVTTEEYQKLRLQLRIQLRMIDQSYELLRGLPLSPVFAGSQAGGPVYGMKPGTQIAPPD